MPLTADQRKKIAAKLFLFNASQPVLPVPVNTDALATRMKPVAALPRFEKVSFGVVDFTADRMNPKVFMHLGDLGWRMGSSGKIAGLLAAAQLRDDVRKAKAVLKAENVVLLPNEFDQLFATIWSTSPHPYVYEISKKGPPPRVSTLFDLSQPEPDFRGAAAGVDRNLRRIDLLPGTWSLLPSISVLNRFWLMGSQSCNVCATSCISEIGVRYMMAVQKAYGLWLTERNKGMHMLLSEGYWHIPSDLPKTALSNDANAPKHRPVISLEKTPVEDSYIGANDKLSYQAGSVFALTAYLIALIQDKLPDKKGADAIKLFLADERPSPTAPGSLVHGMQALAPAVTTNLAHAKGGALKAPPSQVVTLRSDLGYMETDGTGGKRKFALVAMGLVEFKDGTTTFDPQAQGKALAQAIHAALIAPP